MQGPSPRKSDRRSVLRAGLARWKGGLLRNGSALVPGVAFPKNRNSEGRETRLLLLPSHIQFAWRPESITKGPRCSNFFKTGEPMSNRFFLAGSIVASAGILALGLAGAGFGTPMEMADKPSSCGFETANLDKTCKPCDDFYRSEEHTSELQSQSNLVCRLLLANNNSISTDYSGLLTLRRCTRRRSSTSTLRALPAMSTPASPASATYLITRLTT